LLCSIGNKVIGIDKYIIFLIIATKNTT